MSKRALLVGCNYPGTDAKLRGCVNDVINIKALLKEHFGFTDADITTMIDTDPSSKQPTGKNIKEELKRLVAATKANDTLVFHFSGHGTQIKDQVGDEHDAKDEAICPTDMNLICDDDLRDIFRALPDGAHFLMISDCCHSGSMLDHPEQQISGNKDPNAPAGGSALPMDSLMSMMGMRGLGNAEVGSEEVKNRGLDESAFCKVFSALTGKATDQGNVRSMLTSQFGADSSQKVLSYVGKLNDYLTKNKMDQRSGKQGQAVKILQKVLGACLSHAGPAGGASGATMPHAGGKPPVGDQLPSDKGILITGCQAHETSADACPSGDPNKAFGALTNALTTCVRAAKKNNPNAKISYMQLVHDVRETLHKTGFKQNPCLECSDTNASLAFIG